MFSQIALASVPLTKNPEDSVYQIVNGFEKEKKNTRVEGGTISLFYFGNSQIFFILCRFSDSGFLFLLNNFRV